MVIIDASIAFKWFFPEQEKQVLEARKLVSFHLSKQEILCAPGLIIYELANALTTKTKLPFSKVKSSLQDLEDLKIKYEIVTFDLIIKSAEIAKKYNISVYDSVYVALAKKKNCNLVTADIKLQRKLNFPFIKTLEDLK